MTTILRHQAPAFSEHALSEPQTSALAWKHDHAQMQAMHRRHGRQKPKKAAPRVPNFLHHLPPSAQAALMRSADAIDHYEKAKALSSGVSQVERARNLTSGEASRPRSTGSVRSSSSSSTRGGSRRSHRLESLSAPDLPPTAAASALMSKERPKSGTIGELEIRLLGATEPKPKEADAVKEARRKRSEAREARRDASKEAAHVGLPPIRPVASGSITMTVAANGKKGMGLLVGREASELAELGGLISPSAIDSFDFSAAFMTPEMSQLDLCK